MAGLAVHTDTARDIYIAGLLGPGGQIPDELDSVRGPMSMEYRIATRRISSRGFSGTLLLQAELGSGTRAPEAVIDALGELKMQLQGSLLSGDQFEIALSPAGDTQFVLNGVTLLELPGADTFSYLLQGWLGNSASALMRESLLSGQFDRSLMLQYESLMPLNERIEQVAGWVAEEEIVEEEQVAVVAAPEPAVNTRQEAVAATAPAAAAVEVAAQNAAPVPVQELPQPPAVEEQVPEPELAVSAPVEPLPVAETAEQEQSPLQELDDREYQRQLSEYVRVVMTQVFRNVRYPRRAVKRELQGQVELLAELDQSGELLGVSLETSSGYDILDEAAIRAVEKATPFPELSFVAKEEFVADTGDSYVMLIPVKFMMN